MARSWFATSTKNGHLWQCCYHTVEAPASFLGPDFPIFCVISPLVSCLRGVFTQLLLGVVIWNLRNLAELLDVACAFTKEGSISNQDNNNMGRRLSKRGVAPVPIPPFHPIYKPKKAKKKLKAKAPFGLILLKSPIKKSPKLLKGPFTYDVFALRGVYQKRRCRAEKWYRPWH